jgi:putative FmdB family regulatory protein
MPVYEYECGSCGGRFELLRKFSDPAITECKLCKAGAVRKVLSPTAFVLKGTGWYATDYASSGRKKAEDADKPGAEAKPEAKPVAGCASGTCPSGGACASKG